MAICAKCRHDRPLKAWGRGMVCEFCVEQNRAAVGRGVRKKRKRPGPDEKVVVYRKAWREEGWLG